MTNKIGFYSLRKTARTMCRLVYTFTPVIQRLYPSATALHAALVLANTVCAELIEQIDLVADVGV